MKTTPALTALLLSLPLATACNQPDVELGAKSVDTACAIVLAADAAGDDDIVRLQRDLRDTRVAAHATEHLGYRFVARARVTNDPGAYVVAEWAASCLDSLSAGDPAARLLRGHVLHQMHRFKEAEAIARDLVARREFVLDYGLLGDVLMEQGRLSEAGAAYQKMIDLKPFYQSFARAAHLRWLKGDLSGAMQLMQSALRAASPRDPESVAWAYTRLAAYELQRGQLKAALRMTDGAVEYVPGYAAALVIRGRVFLADRRPADALAPLRQAVEKNPTPEFLWTLAEATRAAGRSSETLDIEARILRDAEAEDPRTLALFLATRPAALNDRMKAVTLAKRELEKREDVFTLDALAWALAANGDTKEATTLMARALSEGTEDGRLFVHAAAIAAADGRMADAARWARKARALRFTLLPSEVEVLRSSAVHHPARGN